MATINILSIDAWNSKDGWSWNAWYKAGTTDRSIINLSTRKLLKQARDEGWLAQGSKGHVAVEDDGHNIVIMDKNTREPVFALEYGSAVLPEDE